MHSHPTMTHPKRFRALLATGVVLVGAFGAAGLATVAATPAGAATTVTYQASVTQPGPLAGSFSGTAAGDGWGIALFNNQVFNISHHQNTMVLACHNQSDASQCWSTPTKTITNGSVNFATPPGAGLYMNQATGKLYTYATSLDTNTAGVVCIDTTKPAADTGTQLFCGFTALSGIGDAPTYFANFGTYSGISAPVQVGTNWYALNEAPLTTVGSGAHGTQNTLLCFSLITFSACPSQPFSVGLGGAAPNLFTLTGFEYAAPIGAAGTDVILPVPGTINSTAVTEMGCFNTTTNQQCAGAWPVSVTSSAGAPFPFLSATGAVTGLCLPIAGNPCYSLTGAVISTPARMPAAVGLTNVLNGQPVVTTTNERVYIPNWRTNAVDCFNYATSQSCTNFPKPFTGLDDLYTVTADPNRANCLWVNSDHGTSQIQNFDAISGATCQPGPIRFQSSAAIATTSATCTPSSYNSIQVTNPAQASYTSGTVQFANASGAILPIAAQTLNQFGVADLQGINFGSTPLPEFIITLNGLTASPANVSVKLSWNATYATACYSNGQNVSSSPGYWLSAADATIFHYGNAAFYGPFAPIHPNHPVVGIASLPSRAGYWEVASDGGIFAFGYAQFYGSMGGTVLNKPIVGIAATPTGKGYWEVASDGGIFNFGDAKFYGSAGNIALNKPIVGIAATPDGGGYWLVASDGGVFSYGDAAFYGSTGNITLNKPIVGMAAFPQGGGYWMVASDGGIFSYGAAQFHGSTGNIVLNKPITGMAPTFDGQGYWLVANDGGIFNFGDAGFAGSAGGTTLYAPIVGMAS
jgi:hypothetical protein